MNVLLTGATGLIGTALTSFSPRQGHKIIPLQRHKPEGEPGRPYWCPTTNEIDLRSAGPIDAVIHLAGENIAQRWSSEAKRRIRQSRVDGTRLLVRAILDQNPRPKVFLCASATGFYGHRGDEILDEQSAPGQGFLADVCREWEAVTEPAARTDLRVVNLRFGIVLSAQGGALKKMLTPFRFGLGGKLSDGRHYWSWIAIHDLVRAIELALTTESVKGPINVVSPNPVRNAEFTKTLASVLHRPAFFNLPKFAIKLLMGEMGEEALLSSFRVKPAKLEAHSFRFHHPDLRTALAHLLGH
jgi:uncharacterized protein